MAGAEAKPDQLAPKTIPGSCTMYDDDNSVKQSYAGADEVAPLDRLHAAIVALGGVSANELLLEAAHVASRLVSDGCTVTATADGADLPARAGE